MALEVRRSPSALSLSAHPFSLTGWILWPALAIMMAESLLSISLVTFSALAGPLGLKKRSVAIDNDEARSLDEREEVVPVEGDRSEEEADRNIVLGGVVLSCVACVVLVAIVFGEEGIKWWATLIALVLASIFSVLG
jgi:amino acid transporter